MTGFDPKSPNVARVYDYGLGGRETSPPTGKPPSGCSRCTRRMVLHFLDAQAARSAVAGYLTAAAPGSYVIASVGHGQGEAADNFFRAYSASIQEPRNRSVAEFTAMLGQLELIPPGVRDAHAWLPGWSDLPPSPPTGDARVIAAVARLA
jgi:hypothetical protein